MTEILRYQSGGFYACAVFSYDRAQQVLAPSPSMYSTSVLVETVSTWTTSSICLVHRSLAAGAVGNFFDRSKSCSIKIF